MTNQNEKLALITELARRSPKPLGRTALMKCLFFLKVLRDVPLAYNFQLYTHGPFDADVLDDLQYAQGLGAIKSLTVAYPGGGRGYELQAGPEADKIARNGLRFVTRHRDSIDWVLSEFGRKSALDLEMASTLVFVDRSIAEKEESASIPELAKMVHAIKPHLTIEVITKEAKRLDDRGLLSATA